MNRKALAILVLIAAHAYAGPARNTTADASSASRPQPAADPVADFKSIVSSAADPKEWSTVFQHSKTGKWAKQYYFLGQVKFDVKKTDSLLNPVIGIVNFPLEVSQSEFFDARQEAEQSTALSKLRMTYYLTGKYLFDGGTWHIDQFSYYAAFGGGAPDKTTVSVPREKLVQDLETKSGMARMLEKWIIP
jgi:hypothetical protein